MAIETDPEFAVRRAEWADCDTIGRVLHGFNCEYDEPTPGAEVLAERFRRLLSDGDTVVVLGVRNPVDSAPQSGIEGLAVLRFRAAIWSPNLECYLAELYVVPKSRGLGLGRRIMLGAIEAALHNGADYMDLGTGENDVAARRLYESLGFDNRGGIPDGPINYFYERTLG